MTEPEIPSALRVRRTAVIAAAALSGLLVLLSMVIDPAPDAKGSAMVAGYAESLTRSGLHTNLIHYGFALMAPVAYAMVALVRGRGAWLANVAGVFAMIGLSTLPGLVLLDFTSVATVLATDLDTSTKINAELEGLAFFLVIIIPAVLTSLLALPLAVIAMWRDGLMPGALALVALPGALMPTVVPVWWVTFGINAAWMLAVAYFLAQIPARQWYAGTAVPPLPQAATVNG